MAPELCFGRALPSQACDIWSFAMTIGAALGVWSPRDLKSDASSWTTKFRLLGSKVPYTEPDGLGLTKPEAFYRRVSATVALGVLPPMFSSMLGHDGRPTAFKCLHTNPDSFIKRPENPVPLSDWKGMNAFWLSASPLNFHLHGSSNCGPGGSGSQEKQHQQPGRGQGSSHAKQSGKAPAQALRQRGDISPHGDHKKMQQRQQDQDSIPRKLPQQAKSSRLPQPQKHGQVPQQNHGSMQPPQAQHQEKGNGMRKPKPVPYLPPQTPLPIWRDSNQSNRMPDPSRQQPQNRPSAQQKPRPPQDKPLLAQPSSRIPLRRQEPGGKPVPPSVQSEKVPQQQQQQHQHQHQ